MTTEEMAVRLTAAFEAEDMALLEPLLHIDVHWGGADDSEDACQSRGDVLSWYSGLRRSGVTAVVTDTVVGTNAVLLTLDVTGSRRGRHLVVHQVFRLADGLVRDIRGFPERDLALAMLDRPLDSQVS